MKIKYEKPMAAVEFYKLSQSIAACVIKINALSRDCVIDDDDTPDEMRGFALFNRNYFADVINCKKSCYDIQDNDSLCYHTQVNATFTS